MLESKKQNNQPASTLEYTYALAAANGGMPLCIRVASTSSSSRK
jgi:hypothetical protein